MRATAQLKVPDNLEINLTITMNVGEMRALLSATAGADKWPLHSLRSVLTQCLTKADGSYQSEHIIDG